MLRFLATTPKQEATLPSAPAAPSPEPHPMDAMTGGAFSAATAGERAAKVRAWLATGPSPEQLSEVFKELSHRDKGAAKPLREKLDELRRAKGQDAVATDWAGKANILLALNKLNMADAIAWQRDAAKAGAPLSKSPLAELRSALAERVKAIEDLQHRVQVQREAAVLLAQRCEIMSTKPWRDGAAVLPNLGGDVQHWQTQADAMAQDAAWPSVDAKFPPLLDASKAQLAAVWDAFSGALAVAEAAAANPAAPLPPVPVWADDIRAQRAAAMPAAEKANKPPKPKVDPEQREQASAALEAAVARLQAEVAAGHGKAMPKAAGDLRAVLKDTHRLIDAALEAKAHAALAEAGELEGWQRWRADQLREELVAKANALVPLAVTVRVVQPKTMEAPTQTEGESSVAMVSTDGVPAETAVPAEIAPAATLQSPVVDPTVPAMPLPRPPKAPKATKSAPAAPPQLHGRKLQEALRQLREQWRQVDLGGPPNHALWKRFDEACNRAHALVETWLVTLKVEEGEIRTRRLALLEELKAWGAANLQAADMKAQLRALAGFGDRWRDAGHMGEKAYAEMQPMWKAAIKAAHAPIDAAADASIARRKTLIADAIELAATPNFRIDAVRNLQSNWQREAQSVPLDRRLEQKLWEQFRSPIDQAFSNKTAEREKAASAISERDKGVLDASKAVDAAVASGDAAQIRGAMAALELALRSQSTGQPVDAAAAPSIAKIPSNTEIVQHSSASNATKLVAIESTGGSVASDRPVAEADLTGEQASAATGADEQASQQEAATPLVVAKPPAKPVVAMRGDDRPGAKRVDNARPDARSDRRGPGQGDRRGPSGPGMGRQGGGGVGGGMGDRRGPGGAAGAPNFGRDGGSGGRDGAGRFGGQTGFGGGREAFGNRGADRYDDRPQTPRLGDVAFHAQRDALERAQAQLRKMASMAHGEVISGLMDAWGKRSGESVPTAADLGKTVSSSARAQWCQALMAQPKPVAPTAVLRLEMAAEVPTPAAYIADRRMLQLQMLTRRNDAAPKDTWTTDLAAVLAAPFDESQARRVQAALKVLLK